MARRFVTLLRRWLCEHEIFIEDIRRVSPDEVVANCSRCGEPLSAFCGLDLPAKLRQKPKQRPMHEICVRPGHPAVCQADPKAGCCYWRAAPKD